MKICPQCNREYPDASTYCREDGTTLTIVDDARDIESRPASGTAAASASSRITSATSAIPRTNPRREAARSTQSPSQGSGYRCRKCKLSMEYGDRFCPSCGATQRDRLGNISLPITLTSPLTITAVIFVLLGTVWGIYHAVARKPQSTAPNSNTSSQTASTNQAAPAPSMSVNSGSTTPNNIAVDGNASNPFGVSAQDPDMVTNFGVPLLYETTSFGKVTPGIRAQRIAARLNDCFLNDLKPPRTVLNMRQGFLKSDNSGTKYVFFGYLHAGANHDTADIIATIDPATAAECKVSPTTLACWWRDILRDWLLIDNGSPPQYTVAYTPVLMDFYNSLPAGNGNDTSSLSRFLQAENTLVNSNDELEKLRLLCVTVPANYVAHPDNYSPSLNDDGGPSTSG